MSRHAPRIPVHHSVRALGVAFALTVGLAALWAAPSAAQGGSQKAALEYEWQVLTYQADDGKELEPVPDGIPVTLLLKVDGETAEGDAACSHYQTTYNVTGDNLTIDATEPTFVECDPASREFDDKFYALLEATDSYKLTGSMLALRDTTNANKQLMVLTRAKIDADPTVARWNLARIGAADGSVEGVIAGLDPWMEFLSGGSLVGQFPKCGSLMGKYATNQDTIAISDLHYRLQCPTDAAQAQADATIASLTEVSRFDVRPAGLRLLDGDGVMRLAFAPAIDLGARIWTPTVIYDQAGGIRQPRDPLSTSSIQLNAGKAAGATICRPFKATGIYAGLALNIVAPEYNKKWNTCKKFQTVEDDYIAALEATASQALRGSELEFMDVDGNSLMLLEPQAELTGTTWQVEWLGPDKAPVTGDNPLTVTFDDVSSTVFGDTGVVDNTGSVNSFLGFFERPGGTRIKITVNIRSEYCSKKKPSETQECAQEALFLRLLEQAQIYRSRSEPTVLNFYVSNQPIMQLVPQHLGEE